MTDTNPVDGCDGTLMLSQLVRADVAKELVFSARMFDGRKAFALGVATRLSDNPYEDAHTMANEIAGRSPDAVRGAKALITALLHEKAAQQFAEERQVCNGLVGKKQGEAVMSNFEKRPAAFID